MLREAVEVWINPEDRALPREELLRQAATAHGVLGLPTDRIDAGFFDAAPKLRGYANYAVGYDNIDVPEATRRGIPVSNTPDVLTTATAELAWALICAVARHIVPGDADMRARPMSSRMRAPSSSGPENFFSERMRWTKCTRMGSP